jgi:hypothetical protein
MKRQTIKKPPGVNKFYIISVSVITFVLPLLCSIAQVLLSNDTEFSFELFGKWFIFYAVGVRIFLAGIKQVTDPAFTAKKIFHIEGTDSFPILRELGFANLCFGLIGIISLYMQEWRVVSAFGSGLYYGIAGVQHMFSKTGGANERFAMFTDIVIFILLFIYFVAMI